MGLSHEKFHFLLHRTMEANHASTRGNHAPLPYLIVGADPCVRPMTPITYLTQPLLTYESFETPSLLCWYVFMESLFSDAALPFRSKCLSDKLPKPMRLHLSLFQKLPWRILWNKALAGFLCKLLPI